MDDETKAIAAITKPVNTLIERLSDAVGVVYEPTRIRRKARAEADALAITTQAEIASSELQHRALVRLAQEEAKKQENIESILDDAMPKIEETAKPEEVDVDWFANFFEKAQTVSNDEVQKHWSDLIAGEINAPGSYSKRTVNLLHSLDRTDAEAFELLCRFVWYVNEPIPLIFDHTAEMYTKNGLTFSTLQHLSSLDLIHFNSIGGFQLQKLKGNNIVSYCSNPLQLSFGDEAQNLEIGKVRFTQVGTELFRLTNAKEVPEFFKFVSEKWSKWTGASN